LVLIYSCVVNISKTNWHAFATCKAQASNWVTMSASKDFIIFYVYYSYNFSTKGGFY
jgi:hypothetical protein